MRELKFRGYDPYGQNKDTGKNGVWLNPLNLSYNPLIGYVQFPAYGDRYIWQQFTGLIDNEGKEIYEGDILEVVGEGLKQEVKFGKLSDGKNKIGVSCFYLSGVNFGNGLVSSYFDEKNYKVVGNIHENKDLLK